MAGAARGGRLGDVLIRRGYDATKVRKGLVVVGFFCGLLVVLVPVVPSVQLVFALLMVMGRLEPEQPREMPDAPIQAARRPSTAGALDSSQEDDTLRAGPRQIGGTLAVADAVDRAPERRARKQKNCRAADRRFPGQARCGSHASDPPAGPSAPASSARS